ncbi:glycosyltransferase family 2 protein [Mangrovimicrobium sediminis]|uniref:Glycosyltransferase family 2 protein n=1 Tax=Mangrovimicrobium sediminis TaxID=2562682 RepID=A0A4Z0LZX2_9GAMM|nr:glycosyltransferase family A protein [Haliea sp. SAOS-164]TGD72595.1 glycosyltransferase family 2 protein [Haliea sp. SAOS-164]
MSSPRIAVCIPAYNARKTLDSTLASVQRQSWPNLEIVICVDPSRDGTLRRARKHARHDSRIRVLENRERLGWAGNVRETIASIDSDWWSVLPQDDLWHPDYLTALWQRLQQSGADFSYCDLQAFAGRVIFGTQVAPDFDSADTRIRLRTYCSSVANPNLWHGLFPAALARDLPFPAEPFNFPALDNLWSHRVLCHYRGARLPQALYFKRTGDASIPTCTGWWSTSGDPQQRAAHWLNVTEQMQADAQAVTGEDNTLTDALGLAMDARAWVPPLLRANPREEQRLYRERRPADDAPDSPETSLGWLLASRCSQARGDTPAALFEAQRATGCADANWRVWQNLARLHVDSGDVFRAQEVLHEAATLHPNQFQLGLLARGVANNILGQALEDRTA